MRLAVRLLAAGLAFATSAAAPAEERWVASWWSPPVPPVAFGTGQTPAIFENETVRQTLRLSVGGTRLRIRLANEHGRAPMRVAAVRIALADADHRTIAGSSRTLTFDGKRQAWLPAGAPLLSDPVEMRVSALQNLVVSVHFAAAAMPGGHLGWVIAGPGDQGAERPMRGAVILRGPGIVSGVDVEATRAAPVIVAFGDSIVEGIARTSFIDMGWPQQLARRFALDPARKDWSVVNAGIGGNRLLHEGFALPALARFDRDALAVPGVTHIILLEGINDIGWSYLPESPATAEAVIAAQRQLVERAHARGIRVIGATLPPFKGAVYYTPAADAMRQAVNRFIRTSPIFDGVIDFEKVVADPADPARLDPAFDPGDHLHPNDAGNTAMMRAISPALFERRR